MKIENWIPDAIIYLMIFSEADSSIDLVTNLLPSPQGGQSSKQKPLKFDTTIDRDNVTNGTTMEH